MKKYQVTLLFRKLRATGNFSIETSFERMIQCFPQESEFQLKTFTSSFYSNGILSRILGILEAKRHCTDINHMTGDAHYLALGLPRKTAILTVHDCGFMNHSNPIARLMLKWMWLKLPVGHCRYVTAVSNATKQDIINYTGCKPEKIVVIPTIITGDLKKDLKPFNKKCPRILHIGLAPNKNFNKHVEAISNLDCELHIIGKLESHHKDTLDNFGIQWSSEYNISQDEMQRAYAESDIILFASKLEGFGMPIIEGQTVGRAVVTSNISSMPEVAGEGACLVDPYDSQSIKEGVQKIIEDEVYRNSIIEKGFDNVQRYQAHSVALQYEHLYRQILNK